jgi:flagellar hook-associated protein 2
MSRIQSSIGLVTGIEIEETVNKLMSVAAQPRDTLTRRQQLLQAQQAAVTDLTALTLGVQLSIRRFSSSNLFDLRTVTSTNANLLSATASAAVPPGQYQFVPVRAAQSHQLVSSGVAARDQALGGGSLTFRFGGEVNPAASLDDLKGGAGVARGKIKITDRSGNSAVVDLRYAQSIDDVVAAINAADEIEVTAEIAGDRLRLVDSSGGSENLRVSEVSGGSTAADLGLANINVAADQADGQDLVRLFEGLALGRLNDGNGIGLRMGLDELEVTFRDGSAPLAIDLNPPGEPEPRTLGEIVDRINAADPARLQAAISADGKRLVLTDLTSGGGTFAVADSLGSEVATQLGLTETASSGTINGRRLVSGLKTTLLHSLGGGDSLGTLGTISLTDRSGASANVNLAAAETLHDVIEAINGAGLGIRAEYNASRSGLQIVDTTGATSSNLIVADGDATNSATKLGLAADVEASEIRGSGLDRQVVNRNTLLASYGGGSGVSLGTFQILDSAGQTATVNLNFLEAKTVGDVIDAINGLSLGVEAKINDAGDGIALVDTAGGSGRLTVSDIGSGRTAADLRLAGTAADVTVDNQTQQVIEGSTAFRVTLEEDETLDDLVLKINALGAKVTAGVLNQGSGSLAYRLSLASSVSGKAGEILIDASELGFSFQELAPAQDAIVQLGTGSAATLFSSSTDRWDNIVEGLNVTLSGTSTDPVTLSVSLTGSGAADGLQTFVDNYNKLRDKLATYTQFNPDAGTKGTLFGSQETLRLDAELSRLISGRFFGVGNVQSLAELGVSLDDSGKLSFDRNKFQARYGSDPEGVVEFFSDESNGFAAKADAVLERLVGRDGSALVNRAQVLSRQVEDFTERIATWDGRLERQRERLLNDFYRIELIVSRIRTSMTAVSQIQAIPPFYSSGS